MSLSQPSRLIAAWAPDQYALLDFGEGRKLESFAGLNIDRPSPPASPFEIQQPNRWSSSIAIEDKQLTERLPSDWRVHYQSLCFHLKLTPFGHVGIFPEQAACWQWLTEQIVARKWSQPPEALNLFGYTGGSTLAMAAAGARVVHVDASAPAVKWARVNASASQLEQHPIRWIVEDARKFVQREVRRGRRYDLIVMDPPSYGHGPGGKPWEIEQHLPDLLEEVVGLFRDRRKAVLLVTGHSELPGPVEISQWLEMLELPEISHGRLALADAQGRFLDAGFFVRTSETGN